MSLVCKYDKKFKRSVLNSQWEIHNWYQIRWFKCELKQSRNQDFLHRGPPTQREVDVNLLFWPFHPQIAWNWKKNGRGEWACIASAPLGSANVKNFKFLKNVTVFMKASRISFQIYNIELHIPCFRTKSVLTTRGPPVMK